MAPDISIDRDDPPTMAPEARLREIAAIFAGGLIRLHERAARSTEPADGESQKLVQKGLEESG